MCSVAAERGDPAEPLDLAQRSDRLVRDLAAVPDQHHVLDAELHSAEGIAPLVWYVTPATRGELSTRATVEAKMAIQMALEEGRW